jgi:hypothetical protein
MLTRHACRRAATPGVLAVSLAVVASTVRAQTTFEDIIRQQNPATVRGYLQPLADILAANLNVGFYHSALVPKSKLGFGIELVGMASQVKDAQRVYTASTPPGFNPSSFQTATIFGGTGSTVTHVSNSSLQYRGSDGLVDSDNFPSAAPQIRIGGIFGTEVVFRYLSSSMLGLKAADFPQLKVIGYGLRHSISQYFSALPVDIAVSFFDSDVTWGDIVDMESRSFGAQVGKSLGLVSVFGGLEQESGKMKLTYTSTSPTAPGSVRVDLDVKGQTRFSAGALLKVGPLQLFGDGNFGKVTTFSGGLRIGT